MGTSVKLTLLLISFLFIVGCTAESPTTASTDNSSSTSTDTTTTTTTTTSYVGKWIKSDNTVGVDWRSDSFVYMCANLNNIAYAVHGSYSSSNTRLTWWDGSYNTVSPSGSNIIVGSSTLVPAVLYAACNPFWTNSTSENNYYTNAAKGIGYWKFVYTYGSYTYTDYKLMSSISSKIYSDGNYYTYGTDSDANVVTGGYLSSSGVHDILDPSASAYSDYYAFTLNSTYTGISSGCYYYYNKSNSTYSSCSSLSGTKVYGTPRAYRNNSEIDEDTIALQKQKYMQEILSQGNNKFSEKDIAAFKRYKQLLQTHNSVDKEPLKKYLQSFRKN